ncbi:MAG: DUF6851 domain-containing protein [Bacteroidota bacterium]
MRRILLFLCFVHFSNQTFSQHSIARKWNEVLLEAIRNDFARPTVHARNLFHTSVVMYDAWAAYDPVATTYKLGKDYSIGSCFFEGVSAPSDIQAAQTMAISYACYRLLTHRFEFSPGVVESQELFDDLMTELGYSVDHITTDYENGDPAALGNYIAQCMIDFGLQDGSNEQIDYGNIFYSPVNPSMAPALPGNPLILDYNRWQPLSLDLFIDQGGNPIPVTTPDFLSPEWGKVIPFALKREDLVINERDGFEYYVYHDPGYPPYLLPDDENMEEYQWGFSLVSIWSAHLDPSDGVMWDISPNSIGNVSSLPNNTNELRNFYDMIDGGDPSAGRTVNPVSGQLYQPQIVPRGDYTRVLAEFWADGPDSETPPGHWFTIMNYVNDHPLFEKRYKGAGQILSDLEWDIRSYLALGGAMHDAAVTAWGIKGWYDYIRPISAIRAMADLGQSSDNSLSSYDSRGIPLLEGYIELVEEADPLAGESNENVGKVKLRAWKGPEFIEDPQFDKAGVGWILAENWWPYQRPTFITPPFAGYISGHSTYSRAAAEVLTLLTGDEYFPGGLGEFEAKANEFLVFEEGPSVDITLQWATYQDASDQSGLSRIWGGIHPPVDDVPGRIAGIKIGIDAFQLADNYFSGTITSTRSFTEDHKINLSIHPNPSIKGKEVTVRLPDNGNKGLLSVIDLSGKVLLNREINAHQSVIKLSTATLHEGLYIVRLNQPRSSFSVKLVLR